MTGIELIEELQTISEENKMFVSKKLTHLSADQLNWKPNNSVWSLNEIFAHLNEYASFYHASFEKVIGKTRFRTPTQNFISSPLGGAAWKSMKLGKAKNVKRKFKALAIYNPSLNPSLVTDIDKDTFLTGQNDLIRILDLAKLINIRKAKTALSISKIIKFRLGDAMCFVVYHNQRHIQQAQNLLDHPKFPKKK
jgi:hypothetical protein